MSLLVKRTPVRRSVFLPNKRRINLTRPSTYRTNQAWQDWRAMKYIARRPLNIRTGGFLGKELKFVDYQIDPTLVTTAWMLLNPAVGALNAIAQGAGESQRIGRKVTNASLHIRGRLAFSGTNITTSRIIRIVVLKDSQANGATITPANVFNAVGDSIDQFRDLERISRFQVLYDKRIALNPAIGWSGAGGVISNQVSLPFAVNLRCPTSTNYSAPTADVSDIVDNAYHIIASASGTGVAVDYTSRFRYRG